MGGPPWRDRRALADATRGKAPAPHAGSGAGPGPTGQRLRRQGMLTWNPILASPMIEIATTRRKKFGGDCFFCARTGVCFTGEDPLAGASNRGLGA
jgi:hypothetical protein